MMFRHLRNRLIFINLAVTTAVLVLAFSAVYVVARGEASRRRTVAAEVLPGYTQIVVQTMNHQIRVEQQRSLNSLLVSLVVIGLSVEFAVAVLSYILAEAAIRPVKEAYESQKVFIANASHEMKTPIAAIMANLEVADIRDNQWIDNVSHEVQYMADLNQELLTLARAENAMTITKTPEVVDLKTLVEETISPFRPRIESQKVDFKLTSNLHNSKIKLVKNDFRQIITILLDNALKYCDHTIKITLTGKQISIENDGAVIPAEKLSHVFDRFYQCNKTSEGVGLGLSIAKTLADHNGWKLRADSAQGTTKFTLTFARLRKH